MRVLGAGFYSRVMDDESGASFWPTYPGIIGIDGSAAVRFEGVDISPFAGVAGTFTPYKILITDDSAKVIWGYLAEADAALDYSNIITTDMETGDGGDPWLPTGWLNYAAAAGELIQDAVDFHGGSNSLQILGIGGAAGINKKDISMTVGKLYKLSAWIKRTTGNFNIIFRDNPSVTAIATIGIIVLTSGYADWTKLEFYLLAEQTSAEGEAWFYVPSDTNNWNIDDISIDEVTALGTDGCHVVSTKNGSTRNWNGDTATFNWNDSSGYTFEIVTA